MLCKQRQKVISRLLVFGLLVQLSAVPLPVVHAVEEAELVCTLPVHSHTQECLGEVICGKAEQEAHHHSQECLGEQICEKTESAGHAHSDSCFETVKNLICPLEEGDEHTHEAGCYEEVTSQICVLEESESHTHGDSCRELACGKTEGEGHAHEDACRETVCGQTVHVHDAVICYAAQTEPVCTCGTEDETHAEACPLYEAPEEDPQPEEEEKTLYERLLACETVEDLEFLLITSAEEDLLALTPEELDQLTEQAETLPCEDEDLRTDALHMLQLLGGLIRPEKEEKAEAYAGEGAVTLYIDQGSILITSETITGVDSTGQQVTAPTANGCIITQTPGTTTVNTITVEAGAAVDIILAGVTIEDVLDHSPLHIGWTEGGPLGDAPANGTAVNLTLEPGTVNTLTTDVGSPYAAIQTNIRTELTIDGTGSLIVSGGNNSPGIGGGPHCNKLSSNPWYSSGGVITILNGNITARGGAYACAIGSGSRTDETSVMQSSTQIHVLGGIVRAYGNKAVYNYGGSIGSGTPADDIGSSENAASNRDGITWLSTVLDGQSGNAVIYANDISGMDPATFNQPGIFVTTDASGSETYHIYADTVIPSGFELPHTANVVFHNGARFVDENNQEADVFESVATLYVDDGSIVIGPDGYTAKDANGNTITRKAPRDGYIIKQHNAGTATANTITVEDGTRADITLAGVNIKVSGDSPFHIGDTGERAKGERPQNPTLVNLTLEAGTQNTLVCTKSNAALQTNETVELHIRGSGTLIADASTDDYGAAIGSGGGSGDGVTDPWYYGAGKIFFWGGNITATTVKWDAAIGEGDFSKDLVPYSEIYLLGGTIKANAQGGGGCDIGYSHTGNGGTIAQWENKIHTEYNGTIGNATVYANLYADPPGTDDHGLFMMEQTINGQTATVCHVYGETYLPADFELPGDCAGVVYHNGIQTYVGGVLTDLNKRDVELYIDNGSIIIGPEYYTYYDSNKKKCVGIHSESTQYVIGQNNTSTTNYIRVEDGVNANITLAGVNIKPSSGNAPLHIGYTGLSASTENPAIENTIVNLTLAPGSQNTLVAPAHYAGIQTTLNAELNIDGPGALNVEGGYGAAGIGGGPHVGSGGSGGAGFSSAVWYSSGGTITIRGGDITATGGSYATAIGNGSRLHEYTIDPATRINILGGTVRAYHDLKNPNNSDDIGASDTRATNRNEIDWFGSSIGNEYGNAVIFADLISGESLETAGDYGVYVRENVYHVYAPTILGSDLEIPSTATLYIHEGGALIVPEGVELINNAGAYADSRGPICLDLGSVYSGTCGYDNIRYEIVDEETTAELQYYVESGEAKSELNPIRAKHYAGEGEKVRVEFTGRIRIDVFDIRNAPLQEAVTERTFTSFTMPKEQVVLKESDMILEASRVRADVGRHFAMVEKEDDAVELNSNGSFSVAWQGLSYIRSDVEIKFDGGLPAGTGLWLFDLTNGTEYYHNVTEETDILPLSSFCTMGTETAFSHAETEVDYQLVVQLPGNTASLTGVCLQYGSDVTGNVSVTLNAYDPGTLSVTNVQGGEEQITASIRADEGILAVTLLDEHSRPMVYPAGSVVKLGSAAASVHGARALVAAGNDTLTIEGLPAGAYGLRVELCGSSDADRPMADVVSTFTTGQTVTVTQAAVTAATTDTRYISGAAGGTMSFTTDAVRISVLKKENGAYTASVPGITVTGHTVSVSAGTAAGTYRITFGKGSAECIYNFIVYD